VRENCGPPKQLWLYAAGKQCPCRKTCEDFVTVEAMAAVQRPENEAGNEGTVVDVCARIIIIIIQNL